jgi:hypothetical protein
MDRQAIVSKIQAMMALQASSTFEGEASAAAAMIDKLCQKYGISLSDAIKPQILDEVFTSGRTRDYTKIILTALAKFYDAKAYFKNTGDVHVIGSEAQQIQVKLYYEFVAACMEQEAKKAYEGEKILADLLDKPAPTRSFLHAFKLAFSRTVSQRLAVMKVEQNRKHEHAEYTSAIVKTYRFGGWRGKSATGSGALAGNSAGNSVSLNKQAGGSSQRQLCGV